MFKLLVGLGNPGAEYAQTRHNAGFWWINELAHQYQANVIFNSKFHGATAKISALGHNFHILQPMTFMNNSGQAVVALANFYKILPDEILVIHDELDLLPGQAKLKKGGSHAGHNGLKDIKAALGSEMFWRLRLGIAHPGSKGQVINWVLKKPSLEHRIDIDNAIDRSLKLLPELLNEEFDKAIMLLHAGNSDYSGVQ